MIIHKTITIGDKPTKDDIKEIREAKKWPIVFDEDSPEITPEMAKRLKRVSPKASIASSGEG